jgi:hypothetical protein
VFEKVMSEIHEVPLDFAPGFDDVESFLSAFKLGFRLQDFALCQSIFACDAAEAVRIFPQFLFKLFSFYLMSKCKVGLYFT